MASPVASNSGVPSSAATVGSASPSGSVSSTPAVLSAASPAAPGASVATAPDSVFNKKNYLAFWDVDGPGVDTWIGTIPGPFQQSGNPAAPDPTTTKPEQGTYQCTAFQYTLSGQVEDSPRSFDSTAFDVQY